jgi:hypothetical protein
MAQKLVKLFGERKMVGWVCCLALPCKSLWELGGRAVGLVSLL